MKTAKRFFRIVHVFLVYVVFYRFNGHRHKILGRRLREACESLGPTFIKIGQLLSTRYDVLPEKDCNELQKLLDDVKPIPYIKIREIFKHDFGKYPEELFQKFDKKHMASASVSLVYKAKLTTGEDVVVKIRRPHIGKNIKEDMKLLRGITKVAQLFSSALRTINAVKLLRQMESWLLQEINFENEAKNIVKIKKFVSFKNKKSIEKKFFNISFVDIHQKFCSRNVITMNYVEGTPLNKLHEIKNNPRYDALASLKLFLSFMVYSWFNKKTLVFQADPHPANLVIQENGKIAVVDMGLVDEVDEEPLTIMRKLLLAVYSGNVDEVIRWHLRMCNVSYGKYHKRVRNDFKKFVAQAKNKGVGFWFMEPIKINIKHKIPVPHFLSSFGRSNFIFEGNVQLVSPTTTTVDLVGDVLRAGMRKEILNNIKNINYESVLYTLSEKIKTSPEKVNKLLDRYFDNPDMFFRDLKKMATV